MTVRLDRPWPTPETDVKEMSVPVHDTVAQPRTEPDDALVPADDLDGTADTSSESPTAVSEGGRSRRLWRSWRSWGWRGWLVVAVVAALVAAGATGWMLLRSGEEPAVRSITATATVGEATRTVSASGTLEPTQSSTLGFEVSGTVTAVLVDLGDTVKKNQALARVSTTLLDAQLEAAQSAVDAAEDELDDAEEGGSSVVLSAAQAQLVTARDDLRAAQEAVENAVLRAPFAGQVVSLDLSVGDVVGTGSGSAGTATSGMGAPAAGATSTADSSSGGSVEVASVDSFVVETTVSSSDLESVKKGLQAEVTAAEVDETLYGTVSDVGRVATTTSAGAAAFPVTVELTGDVDGVYGGTSATVDIVVEKRVDVLTVPTRALRSEEGRTYVVLVGADGESAQRDVEVGETYGEATEILDGLEDGDQIEMMSLPGGGGGGTGGFPGGGGDLPGGGQMPPGGMPGGGMRGGMPGGGMPGGTR
jgi:multidrug efflux pump subunit AcrA (membrane-fusion protein)